MDPFIRLYKPEDAPFIVTVRRHAIEQLASKFYNKQQIETWVASGLDPDKLHKECTDGRQVWVAVTDQDQPLAYIDLEEDGHLDHLYCAPEAAGQGVASKLYNHLEKYAKEQKMTKIYTEASEAAKVFFTHKGFEILERQELEVQGVPVHNYRMEKRLSSPL